MRRLIAPKDEGMRAARSCLLMFLLAVMASFAYIISTGTYNGDFYGVPENLGLGLQVAILFAAIAPYMIGWYIYKYFKARSIRSAIPIPDKRLTYVYFSIIIWFIFLAYKYDVGVLGKEVYDAPQALKLLIQLSNRINPYYLCVFFIISHKGSAKLLLLGIFLFILLGLLRASLGVFLYIFLALIIRYNAVISGYIKRNKFKLIFLVIAFPTMVSELYSLRSSLREQDDVNIELALSATEIVTARLMGRISSISNTALIVQETDIFSTESRKLDIFYFQQQLFGGIFGITFLPDETPERLLINIYGGYNFDTSFMTGLPGNLYLAWLKSPAIAIFNLITVIFFSFATFYFARKLSSPYSNEFAFMLLLYPLTSGVGNEFSTLTTAMVAFCVLFFTLNILLFRQKGKRVVTR